VVAYRLQQAALAIICGAPMELVMRLNLSRQQLGRSRRHIGDHDEFFDLGGTSFSLLQMLSQVNEQFNTNLRISVFGEGASISVLASALERHTASQPNQSTK
jgi:hypothetical protein